MNPVQPTYKTQKILPSPQGTQSYEIVYCNKAAYDAFTKILWNPTKTAEEKAPSPEQELTAQHEFLVPEGKPTKKRKYDHLATSDNLPTPANFIDDGKSRKIQKQPVNQTISTPPAGSYRLSCQTKEDDLSLLSWFD
jgi:hypothetical protein